MKKVQGQYGLYKKESGAIVNADWSAYNNAKKRKQEQHRVDEMENRLERIEQMLKGIMDVIKT